MDLETKIRENRLRRAAKRQGLFLSKCKARDPQAEGFGKWAICDSQTGNAVNFTERNTIFTLNLETVEKWLGDPSLPRRVQK